MKFLIIKIGATGDVVRTSTLLHVLQGEIDWLTSDLNTVLLEGSSAIKQVIPWSQREALVGRVYDYVINLEDQPEVAEVLNTISYKDLFGAFLKKSGSMEYTHNSKEWFDLSLISRFGKKAADALKLKNRKSYQELIFKGLGFKFDGAPYFLPTTTKSTLKGDIALASEPGTVWPMKKWAYYEDLKIKLENDGFSVNYLPIRDTLKEHIADIKNHRYLVSGDSLPMHIALGSGIHCLGIFICTSPWEIYGYGLLSKVISPDLPKFFYRRDNDPKAKFSIQLKEVYDKVNSDLNQSPDKK